MAFWKKPARRPLAATRVAPLAVVALALAVAAVAAAAGSHTAGSTSVKASNASAVAGDVSSNWSGYVAAGTDDTGWPSSFSNVSGTWVQPAADCTSSAGTTASSAFWVGIGGDSTDSNALEQAGTEADCTVNGTARYSAWYELVPAASVRVPLKVSAGDTISASVSVSGTSVTVILKNATQGTSYSKSLTMASPDTSSAEWIAEAPSLCSSSGQCQQTDLTNFGTVKFSNATATSNGHTGSISDPAWSATAIQLAAGQSQGDFARYAMQSSAAQATPTALRQSGKAFSVKWEEGSGSSDPSYGSDPYGYGSDPYGYGSDPYGYGSGYGNGYGSAYGSSSAYGYGYDPGFSYGWG